MDRTGDFAVSLEQPSGETANQITHGLGFLLTLLAAPVMVSTAIQTGGTARIVGCCLYAFSLVGLYAASTLSHSFERPRLRCLFRMWDQVFICLFIAASYTPYALVHLNSLPWWTFTAIIWAIALLGMKLRFASGEANVATTYLVVLGCLPCLTVYNIASISGLSAFLLVILAACSYFTGLYFFTRDHRHPYFHAVWHLCVMAGCVFHFFFLLNYVAA